MRTTEEKMNEKQSKVIWEDVSQTSDKERKKQNRNALR